MCIRMELLNRYYLCNQEQIKFKPKYKYIIIKSNESTDKQVGNSKQKNISTNSEYPTGMTLNTIFINSQLVSS